MICAIHQPQYMPWLGYFDKIDIADVFVILDNVQYKKNEWQNRNRIKTSQGPQWITAPVLYKYPGRICEVGINNKIDWRRKHLQALITNYNKAPFFAEYKPLFEDILNSEWGLLSELNIYVIKQLIDALGIKTEALTASDFSLDNDPTGRLVDMCKQIKADQYLSGKDGVKYMDIDKFKDAGIELVFQDFDHPVYNQLYGKFEPFLSIIDLLFNHGKDSLEIIRSNRRKQ